MILAVSPHLDDAVFSVGGLLADAALAGREVLLATVFTRSVLSPRGFALVCQLDKGLGPDVDYMALRRGEDARAAAALGIGDPVHLDLPEAPHRGYGSAAELFDTVHADDPAHEACASALAGLLERTAPERVLCPLGIGSHVDHLVVVAALERLGVATERWRDVPYVLRADAPLPARLPGEKPLPVSARALAVKLGACAAYTTQIGFQFGGETRMRAALQAHAEAEAHRLGASGPYAESLVVTRSADVALPERRLLPDPVPTDR